jgi:hypothetical protein
LLTDGRATPLAGGDLGEAVCCKEPPVRANRIPEAIAARGKRQAQVQAGTPLRSLVRVLVRPLRTPSCRWGRLSGVADLATHSVFPRQTRQVGDLGDHDPPNRQPEPVVTPAGGNPTGASGPGGGSASGATTAQTLTF